MENCLGGQMATGSCGQSCRGVTGGGCGHGDSGAGWGATTSFRPLLLGYLSDLGSETVRTWSVWRNISWWRAATKNQIIIILCFYWWLMVYCLGDYRLRKSHSSWGPGVFNFNTLTFMLSFWRYVLLSKSSNCSAIVHRESSRWRHFHFHSENLT